MINLVYFGSPDFSADFLEKLILDNQLKSLLNIKYVFTQPDKPAGRKQILTPTPIKQLAEKYKIPVFQINQKNSDDISFHQKQNKSDISDLSGLLNSSDDSQTLLNSSDDSRTLLNSSEIDIALVYSFARIIPKNLLNLPKYGFWCIHPSLLPKYRGTSPIATALINGDKETGVTIFKMDEKIDHGPIIVQKNCTIELHEKRPDLEIKLTNLAFEMFKKLVLSNLNNIHLVNQQENLASYTKKLNKNDGFIKFFTFKKLLENQSLIYKDLPDLLKEKYKNSTIKQFNNLTIYNLYRGLYPWPGLWTILPNGKRLKIIELELQPTNYSLEPKIVQLEGKKPVDFETFNNAYKII